jgi:hypothetical protein
METFLPQQHLLLSLATFLHSDFQFSPLVSFSSHFDFLVYATVCEKRDLLGN